MSIIPDVVLRCKLCGCELVGIDILEKGFDNYCLDCYDSDILKFNPFIQVKPKRVREISYDCGQFEEVYTFEEHFNNLVYRKDLKGKICEPDKYEGFRGLLVILNRLLFSSRIYNDINFGRRKKKIRRLINSNVGDIDRASFVTLTYKENMKDINIAKKDFMLFIKRIIYHYPEFHKYLWVIERQTRGALHFHIVFFDVPYLSFHILSDIWGKGFVDIHMVQNINNLGSYICKYFNKTDQLKNLSGRLWGYSRSLVRPVKRVSEDLTLDRMRDFDNLVFSSFFDSPVGKVIYNLFDNKAKEKRVWFDESIRDEFRHLPF